VNVTNTEDRGVLAASWIMATKNTKYDITKTQLNLLGGLKDKKPISPLSIYASWRDYQKLSHFIHEREFKDHGKGHIR
jgi:hypothetical protein